MLKIIGWKENYETHETAKIKKLLWIRQNIACDTLSWAKLTLDPERARSVWLGWTAVTWYVAVTSRNGVIDGTADDVSLLTRVPAEDVSAALTWAQGCGLIVDGKEDETKNRENSAESPSPANLPAISRDAGRISRKSPATPGESPANLPAISRLQDRTGQDRTGHVQDTDTDSTVQDTDSTLQDNTISFPFFSKKSPLLSSPELTVVNTNTCASAESDSGDDLISANSAGASDGKGEEILINNGRGEEIASDLATRMAEMAASARRLAGIPTDADDAAPREEERNILSLIPEDACERIDRLTVKPSATYCRIIANNEMVAAGIATATRSELEARAAEVAKRLSSEKSTEKALEARQSTKTGEHARKDTKPAPSHATAPEKGIAAEPHPSREEFLAFCREIDPDWARAEEYYTNLSATGWQLLPRRGETERRPIVNWRRFTAALINNQRGAK